MDSRLRIRQGEPPEGSGGSQVIDAGLDYERIDNPSGRLWKLETEREGLQLHKGSLGTSRAEAPEIAATLVRDIDSFAYPKLTMPRSYRLNEWSRKKRDPASRETPGRA